MSNSFRVGAISAAITLDNNPFKQGIRESIKEVTSLRTTFKAMREDLTSVGRDLSLAGGAITAFFAGTVKAAANVEEAENLFVVSMGSMADSTRVWSEALADSLHLNANTVREMVGEINLLPKAMGFTEQASATMSKELTKLAFDLSSFRNIPFDEAMDKIRSGLTGEAEPMKALGVLLDENSVKSFAFANGIGKVGTDLTEVQKVVARYGIMLRDTADAQGDLARTGGSATNQFRQLKEQVLAVGQNIGKDLLPPVTSFVARANDAVSAVRAWAKENTAMAASITKISAGTGVVTLGIGSMALGIVGLVKAFEVLKKAAAIAWAVVSLPIAGIIAAIAGIAAGIYVARAVWNENFELMASIAKSALDNIITNFGALWDRAKEVAAGVIDFFRPAFTFIADNFAKAMGFIGVDVSAWAQDMRSGMEVVGDGVKGLSDGVTATMSTIGGGVSTWAQDMLSGIEIVGEGAKEIGFDVTKQFSKDLAGLPTGFQDFLKLMTEIGKPSTPEDYKPFDPNTLLEGGRAMDSIAGAAKAAGSEAKKAAEELKHLQEEASDMRLELFPKEGFADAAAHITKLAGLFPETMTGDAVQKGFQNLFTEFETKGVSAAKLLEAGMLAIPDRFKAAMSEAAAGAQVVINEAMMEARAEITDSDHWSKVGDMKARGKDRFASLMDPAGIAEMTKDTVALTAHLQDLVTAGKIKVSDKDNILNLDYWNRVNDLASQGFESLAEKIKAMVKSGQAIPAENFEALGKAAWSEMGDSISKVGASLNGLGAGKIGAILSSFGQLANIGLSLTSTLIGMPALFLSMQLAGVSAAVTIGVAISIALSVIVLVADAIMLVISLFGGMGKEGTKELKGMAKVIDEIKQASDQWADSLTDKLVDAIKTGQFAWRDFVNEILTDILRIATRQLIVGPLMDFAGSVLPFADGGAFDKGHIVRSPELFATKSGPAVRGEAGTEVVMPAVRLRDGTLGVKGAGGGGSNVTIQIIDNRSNDQPPVHIRETRGADGETIKQIIIDQVKHGFISGDFDQVMNLTQMRRGYT